MQFSLRSLLVGVAVLPPILAFCWELIGLVESAAANSRWDELGPFLQQAVALGAVIAGATIIVAVCHLMSSSTSN